MLLLAAGPVSLTILSWLAARFMQLPILNDPFEVIGQAVQQLTRPADGGDSWDVMLTALPLAHQRATALYGTLFFGQHQKFQYPPSSLLPLDALEQLVRIGAEGLNRLNSLVFAANALACAALARLLARQLGMPAPTLVALPAAILAYLFWPAVYALYLGQIQVWIDLLFTLSLLAWLCGHRFGAGMLTGLICALKPQLGLLLLWGIAWREWRFSSGLLLTLGAASCVSVAVYGLANQIDYLSVLGFIARHGEVFRPNQSVNGLMNRLIAPGDDLQWQATAFAEYNPIVYAVTSLAAFVLAALPLVVAWRSRGKAATADLGMAALCFTMASPIAWEHHYGITLPIFLVAFAGVLAQRARPLRIILSGGLGAAYLLVGSELPVLDASMGTAWDVLQSWVLFGAILLLAVLLALTTRKHQEGASVAGSLPPLR